MRRLATVLLTLLVPPLIASCASAQQALNQAESAVEPPEPSGTMVSQSTSGGREIPSSPVADSISISDDRECGTDLSCVDGVDLRMLSVTLPTESGRVPGNDTVAATVKIQNRGTEAAPASEMTLCITRFDCDDASTRLVTIPRLPSGATATATVAMPTGPIDRERDRQKLVAVLDRDELVPDENRDNNVGESQEVTVELPRIEIMNSNWTPKGESVLVSFQVMNRSVTQSTPAAPVVVSGLSLCTGENDASMRFELPSLKPRERWEGTYRLENVLQRCDEVNKDAGYVLVTARLEIDPDRHHAWSRESEMTAHTQVR